MLILTLKLLGVIGEDYGDRCDCGYYLLTDGSEGKLTSISCTNPICPIESQFKIKEMLEILGIKVNLGEEKAGRIVDYLFDHNIASYRNNLDLLNLDEEIIFQMPNSLIAPLLALKQAISDINARGGITLAQYMSLWCFNGIGETYCNRIFSTYSSIEDFYKDMLDYDDNGNISTSFESKIKGYKFISEFIHISFSTPTVKMIYETLLSVKDEVIRCIDIFKIKKVASKILQLCITGEILRVKQNDGSLFKPRERFAEYISNKYNINVILNKNYSNIVDFVIMDTPSNSRKAKAARKAKRKDAPAIKMMREGKDPGCKLITSDELIRKIEYGEF